jgi:hypothetical protein
LNAFEKSIDCALGLALSKSVLYFSIYQRVQKCFNPKIEPVFLVGKAGPERASYGPNMARRGLEPAYSIDIALLNHFHFKFGHAAGSCSSTERTNFCLDLQAASSDLNDLDLVRSSVTSGQKFLKFPSMMK